MRGAYRLPRAVWIEVYDLWAPFSPLLVYLLASPSVLFLQSSLDGFLFTAVRCYSKLVAEKNFRGSTLFRRRTTSARKRIFKGTTRWSFANSGGSSDRRIVKSTNRSFSSSFLITSLLHVRKLDRQNICRIELPDRDSKRSLSDGERVGLDDQIRRWIFCL